MAIFKNAQGDKFIDTDNFPTITLVGGHIVCPLCKVQLCCNKKNCNCGYEKLTLNDTYSFQTNQIRLAKREKLLKVRSTEELKRDDDGKILVYQADLCPNPKCTNHAYYCRRGCISDASFDMSPYSVVMKQF